MTAGRRTVIERLRRAALAQDGGPTDGELMERFTARRDGDALEALIRRLGPMVLAVCRRVLGDGPDAEDAFQAAFLVFVRKAASIRLRDLVGPWLYGVAYRTALKARSAAARRRVQERRAATMTSSTTEPEVDRADLLPLLDHALSRLPDKYRIPIVLCELDGLPRKEAARRLGIPEGTLSSRLATAKRMLARRLAPHAPAPAGAALAAALERAAPAPVPPPLLASTARAAGLVALGRAAAAVVSARVAALAEGALKSMLVTKLTVAVLIAVAVVAAAAAAVAGRFTTPPPAAPPPSARPAEPAKGEKPADEPARGVTAGIVAPGEISADDPELKGELILTNNGDAPVRVCTLTPGNDGLGGAFGQHFRPDWWKSDRPPLEESAKKVKTLAPGQSVSFPFAIRQVHYKDHDTFTITGFYAVEDKEFADKLGLWLGRAEAPPVKVAVRQAPEWGEATDGVQARLRPSKTALDLGETPEFILDVRNQGKKTSRACRAPLFCEVEWDGEWYKHGGPYDLDCPESLLEPGKQIDEWVKAPLDAPWVRKSDKDKRLQITAGKHTVRVAFLFDEGPRPVSQPVEVEVGKESAWGDAAGGVQARVRTPRAAYDTGEAPTFILDLRTVGNARARAIHAYAHLEIEVDGVWYWDSDEEARRAKLYLDTDELGLDKHTFPDWLTVEADKKWALKSPAAGKPDHFPLPPGKHTIRLSYAVTADGKTFKPISGPIEIEVGKESAWGEPDGGVQARIRTPKAVWKTGAAPTFLLDLRLVGKGAVDALQYNTELEIEVDGAWYADANESALAIKPILATSRLDLVEKTTDWLTVPADKDWKIKTPTAGKPDRLPPPPGRHTIRVSYAVTAGEKTFRPVSGPVEIEVGKESAWGEPDGGVQARIRTPKAVWDAGETPAFILDLRNQGKPTPHAFQVPFDCQIEVDGTWYRYGRPISWLGPPDPTALEPGKPFNDWLTVSADAGWVSQAAKGAPGPEERLPPPPGKHIVRIAFPFNGENPAVRPVSGPLEIEIKEK